MSIAMPQMGMEGFYRVEKFKVRGERRIKTFETVFPNLITNMGLNRLGTLSLESLTGACFVGTGTAVPQVSDSVLGSLSLRLDIDGASSNTVVPDGTPGSLGVYAYHRVRATFPEGTGNHNLTEVGIGRMISGGYELWSRQLFLNEQGQPTAITKLNDELLVITYEVRCYPYSEEIFEGPDVDIFGQMFKTRWFFGPWAGFGLNRTRDSSSMQALSSVLGAPGSLYLPNAPVVTQLSTSTQIDWLAYVDNSYQRDVRARFSPASFSSERIRGFSVPAFFSNNSTARGRNWYFSILPITPGAPDAISKNQDQELIVTFRYRWGRKE